MRAGMFVSAFLPGVWSLRSLDYREPPSFASWERALLVLLLLCSVCGFALRIRTVIQAVLDARKDPGFSIHPVSRRIWDFFTKVICQAQVIRERPLPGLAHAFVFWGFSAFAFVTLNHFATAFGIPFLRPDTAIGSAYFLFAGLFAVLVIVSIAGLAARRFLVRPVWLGRKVSVESGVIAALIAVLMLTYLAAFFAPETGGARQVIWWAHTLALLLFLPLIPHTKHLHLLLSPLTVLLSRGSFAAIPPLVGDDDFGLLAGKDVTRLVALQAYSCVECGRCTEHCPAANTSKVLNPKEVILGIRGYLNSLGVHSEQPLLGAYNSQEAVFQCTTCGACEYQCPVGIEHLPVIVGLRRGAVNTGGWEDSYGTKLFLTLERNGNALGMPGAERDKYIQKQQLPYFDGTQEYCLWLGCMGAYDPRGREIVAALASVLAQLGITFGVLRKEKCTGDSARRLGNDLLFEQLARQNLQALEQAGVWKILSICPHCVRTISTDWREFGDPPAVEHHSELLARHQPALAGKATTSTVVFHDPCYLGRYRNVYDEPRAVISRAGRLIEPPRARERGFCCGAGGGRVFLGEESGDRVSYTRARELVATGADAIGTACPFCNTMFRDALAAVCERPPQLLDIAQIAAGALAAEPAAHGREAATTI